MSFGFSPSDFISIVVLANQIYQRCKASVTEFKDLSRDVRSMHIVLQAVQRYWEEQTERNTDLSTVNKRDLQELTESCKEVLFEIQALLEKHGDLGAGGGWMSRMKWMTNEIGPLRMRLLARTSYLSQFNNAITASSVASQQLKTEARVLDALNTIYYGYQKGTRIAPAFSHAKTDNLDLDDKTTWNEIVKDLNDEGIDKESLASQEPFIKTWIQDVITDSGYHSESGGSPREDISEVISFSAAPSFDFDAHEQAPIHVSPRGSPRSKHRSFTLPILTAQTSMKTQYRQPRPSAGSISSQEHGWRPEHRHSSHAQETLMPLFRLEYGVSRDDVLLTTTIEYFFKKLDHLERGLLRRQFDGQILQAVQAVDPTARPSVNEIIQADSKRVGGRFDQTAFVNLFFRILECLQEIKDVAALEKARAVQAVIEDSERWGIAIAYTWLCHETLSHPRILPRGWSLASQNAASLFKYVPEDVVCHDVGTPLLPSAALCTFTSMGLLADFCGSQIMYVLDQWDHENPLDRNYLHEYLVILHNVLDAASKFDVLEIDTNDVHQSELDRLLAEIDLIDLADTSNLEYGSCPIRELRKLQRDCFRSLQKILGFLFDLLTTDAQQMIREKHQLSFASVDSEGVTLQYMAAPPKLAQWQMQLEINADNILSECSAWHTEAENVIEACETWLDQHRSLSRKVEEALTCSRKLKQKSKKCLHVIPKRLSNPVTDKFISLRLDTLKDLPKGNKVFRAQAPAIYAKILVDDEVLHARKARRDGRGTEKIYIWEGDPLHITVHVQSMISMRIYNANRNDRDDEGFMGLVDWHVDTLPTAVSPKTQSTPLTNPFLAGQVSSGKLAYSIHWCPVAPFVRQQSGLFWGHWARKDTSDGRFLFEDLEARDTGPGSRTAIVERRRDCLRPETMRLTVVDTG